MESPRLRQALERARRYVDSRRCRNGGYCFYRTDYLEEPNLFDTYHGLRAYRLLGVDIPEAEQTGRYLDGLRNDFSQGSWIYHYAFARHWLDEAWRPGAALAARVAALELAPPAEGQGYGAWLRGMCQRARLKRTFATLEPAPAIAALLRPDEEGGYGAKPNLRDTALALELLALLGKPPEERERTIRFVNGLQSPSLGFRDTEDSSSLRLDILEAGARCCACLGQPVRHAGKVLQLALDAQGENGAFAETPGGLPTLESHGLGLGLVAVLLGKPE